MNGFKHQLRIMSQCCTRQDNQKHYCNSNFHDAISWGGEDCLLIWNIKPLPLFLPAVSCSLLIVSVPHCYPDVCSTVLFMSNFTTNLFVWNLQEPTTGSIFGVMLFSKKLPEKKLVHEISLCGLTQVEQWLSCIHIWIWICSVIFFHLWKTC